ncbi:MAG: ribonuclease E/G, partial [Marinomonas sp.]
GSIVIDPTEALVSIDINSARATKGGDIEETALQTNLEAADEIARQLRLRDIGGLVVIDFIDMTPVRNQKEVENRMKNALEADRARVQIGRISRFGLLEMSRQRLRPSLGETSGIVCPRCNGQGFIRDVESLALSVLRLIEEECAKERTAQIRAVLPVSVATFLLNEKRTNIAKIEKRNHVHIILVPNPHMETPHFEVERIRDDSTVVSQNENSYTLVEAPEQPDYEPRQTNETVRPQAAVTSIAPKSPAPAHTETPATTQSSAPKAKKTGLFARILTALFGDTSSKQPPKQKSKTSSPKSNTKTSSSQNDRTASKTTGNRSNRNKRNVKHQNSDRDNNATEKSQSRSTRQSRREQAEAGTKGNNRRNNRNNKQDNLNSKVEKQEAAVKAPRQQPKAKEVPEVKERKRDRNDNRRRSGKLKDEALEAAKLQEQEDAALVEAAKNTLTENNESTDEPQRRSRRSRRSRRPQKDEVNTQETTENTNEKVEKEAENVTPTSEPTTAVEAKVEEAVASEKTAEESTPEPKAKSQAKATKPKMSVKAQMSKVEATQQNSEDTTETEAPKEAASAMVETPKAEEPKAAITKEETPAPEASKTEESKLEIAKEEVPVTETPKAEEPKVEAIKEETPVVETVETEAPKTETPVVEVAEEAPAKNAASKPAESAITDSAPAPAENTDTAPETKKPVRAPRRGRGKPAVTPTAEVKAPVELPAAILAQQEKLRLEQEEKRKANTSRRRANTGRVKNDPRLAREDNGAETASDSNVE